MSPQPILRVTKVQTVEGPPKDVLLEVVVTNPGEEVAEYLRGLVEKKALITIGEEP